MAVIPFSDLVEPFELQGVDQAGEGLRDLRQKEPAGRDTVLFGSAHRAARIVASRRGNYDRRQVVIITDDKDRGSRRLSSWQEVDLALSKLSRPVTLHLVVVGPEGSNGLEAAVAATLERVRTHELRSELVESVAPAVPRSGSPSFPLLCCSTRIDRKALSLMSDSYATVIERIERLTGLRYYPVPTVLVDLADVERLQRPQGPRPGLSWQLTAACDLTNVLSLPFHVRALGKEISYPEPFVRLAEGLGPILRRFFETGEMEPRYLTCPELQGQEVHGEVEAWTPIDAMFSALEAAYTAATVGEARWYTSLDPATFRSLAADAARRAGANLVVVTAATLDDNLTGNFVVHPPRSDTSAAIFPGASVPPRCPARLPG
ncbi:MAG: hypothetical protein HY815_12430 [Candidatus Riflebacteria bacterium]|nr:hypothetical protein [Candidatus Riflebacteria bacterium]